jgi:gas vesicle protein
MEDDAFTAFEAQIKEGQGGSGGSISSATTGIISSSAASAVVPPHQLSHAYPHPSHARCPAAPWSARLPLIGWITLGFVALVALSFMYYYARRKQVDAKKERDDLMAVIGSLKEVREEVDALAQMQKNMGAQINNVANHSRSVERWLGQARESWAETIQQLRSEFEAIVEEAEEEEEEEEVQGGVAEARSSSATAHAQAIQQPTSSPASSSIEPVVPADVVEE